MMQKPAQPAGFCRFMCGIPVVFFVKNDLIYNSYFIYVPKTFFTRSMVSFIHNKQSFMRFTKFLLAMMALATFVISCSRSISVQQAANNNYKKCRTIR